MRLSGMSFFFYSRSVRYKGTQCVACKPLSSFYTYTCPQREHFLTMVALSIIFFVNLTVTSFNRVSRNYFYNCALWTMQKQLSTKCNEHKGTMEGPFVPVLTRQYPHCTQVHLYRCLRCRDWNDTTPNRNEKWELLS